MKNDHLDPEFIRQLENCEMAVFEDFFRAAPRTLAAEYHIRVQRLGGALVTIAAKADVLALNRVVGAGLNRPADENLIDQIIDLFREQGVARFFVPLSPTAAPSALRGWLLARGFTHHNNWVRLHRPIEPLPQHKFPWLVRKISTRESLDFGRLVAQSFGWPDFIGTLAATTVGRKNWRHYMVYDGRQPVGAGAFFIYGEFAWFGFAATTETYRGRGIQQALLAHRFHEAQKSGCLWVVVETAQKTPEKMAPSYRNILRFGFTEDYLRPNFLLQVK